jgi:YfiH family protein
MGLVEAIAPKAHRLATARQVHGERILEHDGSWNGWLHDISGADGHLSRVPGTAMAVTLADCVPVFIAHPAGLGAVLHSGWKGTAAGIIRRAMDAIVARGLDVRQCRVHLGPAICGRCYEVSPDVHLAVTGMRTERPTPVDLREVIARQARQAGATVTVSQWCTRCHNERFFSHRAGDIGRQLGVLVIERA